MTDHLQWRIVPAFGGEHVYASFNNEKAARDAAVHMNWMPDRDRVRVVFIESKEKNK